MNDNPDWHLIVTVVVAFIAGYSILGFIVKKIRSEKSEHIRNGIQERDTSKTETIKSEASQDEQKRENDNTRNECDDQ